MHFWGLSRRFTATAAAIALCASPTIASAAVATQPMGPMVALSALGSQASAQALCGSTAAAAVGAAATQAQPACVIPVVDAPPPVPVAQPLPPPPPPPSGFGISPILLGLAGIAILAALIAASGDDDNDEPVSPS